MWITHPFRLHLWRIDKIENQKKRQKTKTNFEFLAGGRRGSSRGFCRSSRGFCRS